MATPDTDKLDVRELLPFYANGTLDDEAMGRVRELIESSPELEAEAAETSSLLKALGEDVPVPMLTHGRIERVMSQLDEQPRSARPFSGLLGRIRAWHRRSLAGRSHFVPLGLAAAAIAAIAIVLVMPVQETGDSEYRTLYEDRPTIPVRVVLADGVGSADADRLFDELSLKAERTAGGTYRVTLPPETSVNDLYQVLQTLRADGRVADAEALTEED